MDLRNFVVSASALILDAGGNLLLHLHPDRGWSLPGGILDDNEDPEETVRREVQEETGLEVQIGELRTVLMNPSSDWSRLVLVYGADPLTETSVPVADDSEKAQWFSVEEAKEVICNDWHRAMITKGRADEFFVSLYDGENHRYVRDLPIDRSSINS